MTRARSDSRVARTAPHEFYVGYVDETPPGIGRFACRLAVGLVVLAAVIGLGLALFLERFDEGVFEYGVVREYEGELLVDPHPRLITVDEPAHGYLLVGVGKHGLDVDGPPKGPSSSVLSRRIKLSGTLIQNPKTAMLEVHSFELSDRFGSSAAPEASDTPDDPETGDAPFDNEGGSSMPSSASVPDGAKLREVHILGDTLIGEIVDTKCYLGAMKPGRGKPHRDCASLCIRGGIPAALLVRTESGERQLVHLLHASGRPVGPELLDWVGQPVEVTGLLERQDARLVLVIFGTRSVRAAASIGS